MVTDDLRDERVAEVVLSINRVKNTTFDSNLNFLLFPHTLTTISTRGAE